ncbi:MAG: nickel transporter permease [Chloroflexota bacterium]|nr:nickel transporter permease [Chloroflexota bacterium]
MLSYAQAAPAGFLGLFLLLLLTVAALLAPVIAPYDPLAIDLQQTLRPPCWEHPLGTDHLGRDVLSRVLLGSCASLGAAAFTVTVVTTIGVALGTIAGFYGGWIDEIIMRLVDTVLAFPSIILALVVAGLLGPGLCNVILGLTLVRWAGCARLVRSLVLSVREREFIMAARSIGASNRRIVTRHLFPSILGPVVVMATLDLGSVMLSMSGLSFIGLGAQLPHPEWGAMVNEAQLHVQAAPWLAFAPGLAIVIAVLSANLLGDTLRDLLDPRYRRLVS